MAGLTDQGLEIKRLSEVLEDNKQRAREIFSDLVAPGDEVDVSDNSALGRMIGVVAPAEADLWEAIQQVYNSFNPNAATGVSLDNLVALSGIVRLQALPTSAQVVLSGDVNTQVPSTTKIQSTQTRATFSVQTLTLLEPNMASGIGVNVVTILANTDYTISYGPSEFEYVNITVNSGATPTEASILSALQAGVNSAAGAIFNTEIVGNILYVRKKDPFQTSKFATSVNLTIVKCLNLANVRSDTVGPLGEPANSITNILVPVTGLDSVYNPVVATTGLYLETDEELRERFRNSKFIRAANIIEALIDALKNVEGVTDVMVYENDTNDTDILGIPAHSFMPIVLGGQTTLIANAVWENKPTGILSFGNTTVQVADSQGIFHAISFQRPTEVPIYISISITDTGGLAGDAAIKIKQAILDYVRDTYFIGDDVIYSRFYTPVNSVPGHMVNSLTIGTAPSPIGTSNIVIDFDEVATFDIDNIVVSIV